MKACLCDPGTTTYSGKRSSVVFFYRLVFVYIICWYKISCQYKSYLYEFVAVVIPHANSYTALISSDRYHEIVYNAIIEDQDELVPE